MKPPAKHELQGQQVQADRFAASFVIQESPIAESRLLPAMTNEGARLVLMGLVRDYNQGCEGVSAIEYQCYRAMAESEGLRILEDALRKFQIQRVACAHRIGLLRLQDAAIRLEIGSGHRLAAFRACEYIMEQIKADVPIWKKEFFASGKKAQWM